MPFPTQSLANNFADWSVTYDIYSGLSGSCNLTNQEQQYTAGSFRWIPFKLTLNTTVISDLADDSCLSGNVDWFDGLVLSMDDSREIASDMVTLRLGSYFSTLNQHPINSQYYTDTAGNIIGPT